MRREEQLFINFCRVASILIHAFRKENEREIIICIAYSLLFCYSSNRKSFFFRCSSLISGTP